MLVPTGGLPDLMKMNEIFEKGTEPEMWRRNVGSEMAGNDEVVNDEGLFRITKTRLVGVQHSSDGLFTRSIVVLNFWEVDTDEMEA